MESHVKWGLGFIIVGAVLEVTMPFLFLIDTAMIAIGIALLIFGGREKRIEEVRK